MTARDFRLIAGTLREARDAVALDYHPTDRPDPVDVLDDLAQRLASALALTNERFDRTRFLAACGWGQ